MPKIETIPQYSQQYMQALSFAAVEHQYQRRQDRTPYLTHLLTVSALVWEQGGTEEEAIAGLLHDYIEDICPSNPQQGLETLELKFGSGVAKIVKELTEWDKNLPWKQRKLAYLDQIKKGDQSVILVSLCDKYHNLLSYVRGAKEQSKDDSQSPSKRKRVLWFMSECFNIYQQKLSCLLVEDYRDSLQKLNHFIETIT